MMEHTKTKRGMTEVCCPSARTMVLEKEPSEQERSSSHRIASQLRQWPVKISLVHPQAPYFQGADLIIVADCVPFAHANFHLDYLKDNSVAIGCPKLDDTQFYEEKIAEILQQSDVKSIKVVHMEVPCCYGLRHVVEGALSSSGKNIPYQPIVISIRGEEKP
jgi:hypothetical protein